MPDGAHADNKTGIALRVFCVASFRRIRTKQVEQCKTLIGKDGVIAPEAKRLHGVAGVPVAKRAVMRHGQKPLAEALADPRREAFGSNT